MLGAAGAALAVAASPSLGWLAGTAGVVGWLLVAGLDGQALLVAVAACAAAGGLRRWPWTWSVPALAPALGWLGLAGVFPALAGQASTLPRRALLGASGAVWLALAESGAHTRLLRGTRAGAERGARHMGRPPPVRLCTICWLRWRTRGCWPSPFSGASPLRCFPTWSAAGRQATDVLGASVWAAALALGTDRLERVLAAPADPVAPRGLIVSAFVAAVVVVGARALRAGRKGPRRSPISGRMVVSAAPGSLTGCPPASVLRTLESKIAGLVEGTFGRVFRSEVRPVELARKLAREMDEHQTVTLSRVYVPNEYYVWLSPEDRERYEGVEHEVIDELGAYLLEHARREKLSMASRPVIEFRTDERLTLGEFGIQARLVRPAAEDDSGVDQGDPGHTMIYSTSDRLNAPLDASRAELAGRAHVVAEGKRMLIGPGGAVLGRSRDCDIVLTDSNVSRRHAEIRAEGSGWTVSDLGSTNGVRVNGRSVSGAEPLSTGDVIALGAAEISFDVD